MTHDAIAKRQEAIRAPIDLVSGFARYKRSDTPVLNRLAASWGNDVYEATFEDGTRRFVRMSREGREGFEREAWALARFAALGIRVPEVITIVEQTRIGVTWTGCVQTAVPGEPLSELWVKREISEDDCLRLTRDAGALAARFHAVAPLGWGLLDKHGRSTTTREDYLSPYALDDLIEAAHGTSIDPGDIAAAFGVVADRLVGGIRAEPSLLHGDFASKHVLVHEGEISGLIDLELVQGGDPSIDLAFWSYFEDISGSTDHLLDGYSASEVLRERVVLGRLLTSLMFIGNYGPIDALSDLAPKISERLRADLADAQ